MKTRRIYVEKKVPYAVKAKELKEDIESYLGIKVDGVRELIRYDVEGISDDVYSTAIKMIFSEPPVDDYYEESYPIADNEKAFSVEALPGQFDQRADSAEQCIGFIDADAKPIVKSAITYVIKGDVSDEDMERIKAYCVNPVDSRINDAPKPETLVTEYDEPEDVKIFDGFKDMDEKSLKDLYDSLSLAMTFKDFLHIQNYFKNEEKRDPSMTEIRVLDTYWSDHCRHTTFSTELKNITFDDGYYREPIETTYQSYLDTKDEIYKDRTDKFVCLMDVALMGMKKLRADGKLEDMEVSDEINACSVVVPVEMEYEDGVVTEEWLVFF